MEFAYCDDSKSSNSKLLPSIGPYACCSVLLDRIDTQSVVRKYDEFIFLIDCSASMSGERIEHALECLDLFLRSLPERSFFNVIQWGRSFRPLFPESVAYSADSVSFALSIVAEMEAHFDGTLLYYPLERVFESPMKGSGVRQLFVITDGAVADKTAVLVLAERYRGTNRCFTLGIGRSADRRLVQALADVTGGQSANVEDPAELCLRVMPQLALSLHPALSNVGIRIEGLEELEISPHSPGNISPNVSFSCLVRANANLPRGCPVLVSGSYFESHMDMLIESEPCHGIISRCLPALFAFESIRSLEAEIGQLSGDVSELKAKCISQSLESGLLCRETAFAGLSNEQYVYRSLTILLFNVVHG
jgi:hypothetical protein